MPTWRTNWWIKTKPGEYQLSIKDKIQNPENYHNNLYIDHAFSNAVSSFFHKFLKGGILFFTDGDFNSESFQTFSQNDIINYAKNNYVPVYIFYFGTGKGKTFLQELAAKTSGYFFEGDELLNPEKMLYSFQNYQSPLYIVYYKSPYLYQENTFRKVYATVQYNGRVGKNWLGYYMGEQWKRNNSF